MQRHVKDCLMGSAVTTLQGKANELQRHVKDKWQQRRQQKEREALATPLSNAIDNEKWNLITVLLDSSSDASAVYCQSIDRTLPLQNAIKRKAPSKVIAKLTRRSARVQIPRPLDPVDNEDAENQLSPLSSSPLPLRSPLRSPLPSLSLPSPPSLSLPSPSLPLSPPSTSPPLSPSPLPLPPITTTPSSSLTPILPLIDTDPISFSHGHHQLGLLQLLMTMIKTEEEAFKLVNIVLDERRKAEVKRIALIDRKNEKIMKYNRKSRKRKKKPLHDATPRNPLLSEVAAHNNTPLHIAVIRCFSSSFQQRLMDVDTHGFDLSLTDASRFYCAALTKSKKGHLPLHLACRGPFHGKYKVKHSYTIISQLLVHQSEAARIPTTQGGRLALHLVLRAKANKSIVQLVLEHYPQAAAEPTSKGNYALHIAIWNCATPSIIRMILNQYKRAAGIQSPSSGMYPVDLALERKLDQTIVADLLREAANSRVTDHEPLRPTTSDSSRNRLHRLMPKLWKHHHGSTKVQTILRRKVHQQRFARLKKSILRVQPWYRGCHVRRMQVLNRRKECVERIQAWIRMCTAKRKKSRREWAVKEMHQWIVDFTWIQPTIDARLLRTTVCVPETQEDFMLQVYQHIAERRNAGETIVRLLRDGFLTAKGYHGYYRAVQQVELRHRSVTLINQTVWQWVCYVKMKRAWKPLLALQCLRVWLRRTTKLKRVADLQLRQTVAVVRFQAVGRSYICRRNLIEQRSVTQIQAWFRCLKSWRKYRILRFSAIQIEKIRRASVVKTKYWWITTPGQHRSRKFEQQARKRAYPTREGFNSQPPNDHHVLGRDDHLFPTKKDHHEHSRLKLRMFLPTH